MRFIRLLALLLIAPSAFAAGVAFVQQATGTATSGTTVTVTLSAVAGVGDALVAAVAGDQHVSSISGAGVTWVGPVTNQCSHTCLDTWYGLNSTGVGTAITITMAATTGGTAANVSTYSRVASVSALDQSAVSTGGPLAVMTTGSITPVSNNGEMIIAAAGHCGAACSGDGTLSSGPTNGFTNLTQAKGGTRYVLAAYLAQGAAAAISTAWTWSTIPDWDTGILSLKPTPVAFMAAGTEGTATAATCAAPAPAGLLADDIVIVVAHSRTDTTHTCSTNCTGWAEMAANAGDATGGRLSVWWKRTAGTESTPTFGGPATESYACRMFSFRGVVASGNPWDVMGTPTTHVSAASFTGEAITIATADSMVVFVGGAMDDAIWGAAGASVTNPTSADTACTLQNLCVDNALGTDNSIFLAYDATPVGTATGVISAPTNVKTLASDPGRYLTFALKQARTAPAATCTPSLALLGVGRC